MLEFTHDDFRKKKFLTPAMNYCVVKDIPLDAFRLSASAHKDHGAEVCVGNYIFFQYEKYVDELKAQAPAVPSSSNAQSGLDLLIQEPALDAAWGTSQSGGLGNGEKGRE
jgi:hypothetical protein